MYLIPFDARSNSREFTNILLKFIKPASDDQVHPYFIRVPLKLRYFPEFPVISFKKETLEEICTRFFSSHLDIVDLRLLESLFLRYRDEQNAKASRSKSNNEKNPDELNEVVVHDDEENPDESNVELEPDEFDDTIGSNAQ
ncbi:hypothetical protein HMI54_000483 [Coelomomyces lativittatus]|nr:hypothetical protein HMI54_000483 [Coelomomyces lativittatus]